MELVGHIVYFHNQQRLRFLGRWTLLEDDTVDQYSEQYDEDEKNMLPIFTGIYQRKP